MTKTITVLIAGQQAVETAVQFLATEYGIPAAEILIQPAISDGHAGSAQLAVDVNDDEVAEIRDALAKVGDVKVGA